MGTGSVKLTVFFEEPFWVGIFERVADGKLSVCKITFGAEPKDQEVWDLILKQYDALKFSPAIETEVRQTADNPKRRQRSAKRQVQALGIGTKSQQALQLQREEQKLQRKQTGKEQQKAEKQRRFDLKQQKQRAKHKGH